MMTSCYRFHHRKPDKQKRIEQLREQIAETEENLEKAKNLHGMYGLFMTGFHQMHLLHLNREYFMFGGNRDAVRK